jgi:hypothetical protein
MENTEGMDVEKKDDKYSFRFNIDELKRIQRTLRWCFQTFRAMLEFL